VAGECLETLAHYMGFVHEELRVLEIASVFVDLAHDQSDLWVARQMSNKYKANSTTLLRQARQHVSAQAASLSCAQSNDIATLEAREALNIMMAVTQLVEKVANIPSN
jgi:hypothetical protein